MVDQKCGPCVRDLVQRDERLHHLGRVILVINGQEMAESIQDDQVTAVPGLIRHVVDQCQVIRHGWLARERAAQKTVFLGERQRDTAGFPLDLRFLADHQNLTVGNLPQWLVGPRNLHLLDHVSQEGGLAGLPQGGHQADVSTSDIAPPHPLQRLIGSQLAGGFGVEGDGRTG